MAILTASQIGDDRINLCLIRERARVHALIKAEGKCHIEYELTGAW